MKIRFWKADGGGCAWYRCELPAATLAARGHDVLTSQVMSGEWMNAEVIVGQRVCNPDPSKL